MREERDMITLLSLAHLLREGTPLCERGGRGLAIVLGAEVKHAVLALLEGNLVGKVYLRGSTKICCG